MCLQTSGTISDEIRRTFVVNLAGHHRPIAELLAPSRKPLNNLLKYHFFGMTQHPIKLCVLEGAGDQLFNWVAAAL